ncbi:HNH endonuclease [Bradyrhizobium sp. ISRA464]|uniref:HNH endonuclease n=1 Tax=Bradyrhizobium sp. ISRA464 TaxID=2866200 RepID=UPI002479F5ED|nr:HNH endonuclease [Bradyrhizobium sp. ISRA464]WGS25788.1 HNH endonuclease [Bradyrhizobium sp. ISRA464]
MARKTKSTRWTRAALLDGLKQLPDRAPIAEALPGADAPLKERWIDWVSNYSRGRQKKNASARTIYNRVQQPRWIVWLAEASGINTRLIRKATNSVARHVRRQTQAKEVRRILPWSLVARHLEQIRSSREVDSSRQSPKHFVGYHNRDEQGPYLKGDTVRQGDELGFVTAKPFREDTLLNQRLWVFEGVGSPKRYHLVSSGLIKRLSPWKRPAVYRKRGRQYGKRIHYRVDLTQDAMEVTDLPWFKQLLRQQQSFRNGFNRLSDRNIIRSLEQLPRCTVTIDLTVDRTSLVADLEQIKKGVKDRTTRKALIDARLGQGQFRVAVEKLWESACGVTGCRVSAVLRASHIKPWSQSNNQERLDPENGILLAAHIDALFDQGLITFSDDGAMMISKRISVHDRKLLGLPGRLRCPPTKAQRHFLGHHRRDIFE